MLKFFIIAMVFFMACAYVSYAHCDDFKYESRGKRDPFVPLVGSERPAVMKLEDIVSIEDVRLEGIAVGAKGDMVAIMNGEMVKERDKFGDVEIKSISKKIVVFLINRTEYTINLSEDGGKKGGK